MSHFTAVETKVKDLEALRETFEELGFEVQYIKSGLNLLKFKDYEGREDPHPACFVVRRTSKTRRELSGKSEIGFEKLKDGSFKMHVDHMDLPLAEGGVNENAWSGQWKKKYAYKEVMALIKAKGYNVASEKTDAKHHVHLTITRSR